FAAARCNGVSPRAVLAFTSAPLLRRSLAVAPCPSPTAACSGVDPSSLVMLTSFAPSLRSS
ncbi:hypothetical protein T484DRAFT_1615373, partial [Baffinella frigidus]